MPGVGTRFKPTPNEAIALGGYRYIVQPHPKAPTTPFSAEGRRAIVYNLRGADDRIHALKVFKKTFRTPALLESAALLARFSSLPGMLAAKRTVVSPADRAAIDCPDLSYATLMQWIPGSTWNDQLIEAGRGRPKYTLETGLKLCALFLEIMQRLEREGIAHTDIAPGNLTVSATTLDIQLLDLEDLFVPGIPQPGVRNTGTAGYRHPSADHGQTTWCPEGDRFAVAVVAAEMLILTNPVLGQQANDLGFFAGDRTTAVGAQRFESAYPFLQSAAPEFAELFKAAWLSTTLAVCPPASVLHKALSTAPAPKPQIRGIKWETISPQVQAAAAAKSGGSQYWTPPVNTPSGTTTTPFQIPTPTVTPTPATTAGTSSSGISTGAWIRFLVFVILAISGVAAWNSYQTSQERIRLEAIDARNRELAQQAAAAAEARKQEEARQQAEAEAARRAEEARKQAEEARLAPSAQIAKMWLDYNAVNGGQKGIRSHISFSIRNLKQQACDVLLLFAYNDDSADGVPIINKNARCSVRGTNQLCAVGNFQPGYDDTIYNDFALFVPYTDIFSVSGLRKKYKVRAYVRSRDGNTLSSSDWVLFMQKSVP